MGDSNSRPDGPKPPALPTALIPDIKFFNCGQTCGQRRFLTSYRREERRRRPMCPKGFRSFRMLYPEPKPPAPKAGVLRTALCPAGMCGPPVAGHRTADHRLSPFRTAGSCLLQTAPGGSFLDGQEQRCSCLLYFTAFPSKVKPDLKISPRPPGGTALHPPGTRRIRTRRLPLPGDSSRDNPPDRTPWPRTERRPRRR